MRHGTAFLLMFFSCSWLVAQQTVSSASTMASVNVLVTDTKGNPSKGEEVIFRSASAMKSGRSGTDGKFTLQLSPGNYSIVLKSLGDTTKYGAINIPELGPGQFFSEPFKVNIKFEPAHTYTLRDVHFDVGKASLRPESYSALNELLSYLQNKPDVRIEIGGHTDNAGKEEDNLKLSQQRAETIRNYLLKKGIAPSRVQAKGYGDTQPVADNDTEEGKQMNRRTEVKLL